jgi:serine phosphatase RsbU (regulator of sigma subunit)
MSEESSRWKQRFERERKARKEAELLLEQKSLELYSANEELKNLNSGLDSIIHKRTELLTKQKEQTEIILSNISHPMLITSKKSRTIIYANPIAGEQYKADIDTLVGSHISKIYVNPDDGFRIRDELQKSRNHLFGMEIRFKDFEGGEFDGILSLVEIDFYGEPALLGMVTDITVQKQREFEVQKLHKDIKSSIEYASIIQKSIIPQNDILEKNFREFFTIWEPRDIVGGDIYFIDQFYNGEIVIMVIDCTGHGVPGAFLTMLVKAIEKQIIEKIKYSSNFSPSEILKQFNIKLRETLIQQGKNIAQSGFDGAVIIYNEERKEVRFSGAKIPLYFVKDGELSVIKGDRQSIGYSRSKIDFQFSEHTISLKSGDVVYITTDGFIDQTGGEKGFPFGNRNFKKLIEEVWREDLSSQRETFLNTIVNYGKGRVRNDDITVVSLRL